MILLGSHRALGITAKTPPMHHAHSGPNLLATGHNYSAVCLYKEAISKKKLLKGEGGWSQWKEILGWILDTGQGTLQLTEHRKNWIIDIFEDLHHKNRVSIKKWQ